MLKALLHGIAQGTMASLRGGDFKAGLSSGFVGSVMGHYTGGLSSLSEHESAQFAITVTMGGLTSRAIGGSFNDGVISSATVFLFNDLAGRNARNGRKELGSETSPNLSQGKYPVKITAVSAQFGAGIEVGDIFLADLANDRIVHYGYFSFPMGFESSADVSLLSGFANITSAGGLDGFSVSFDTEMLIGGGVSATYSYSPTSSVVAAGGGVGFSLGKSITLGRTWFKKSYSSHEFQRAFPLVKGF
jgi:hypothetical protein